MRRFVFRLQRLLTWKRQRERQTELALGQAHADLERCRLRLERHYHELAGLTALLDQRLGESIAIDRWQAFQSYAAQLRQMIRQGEEEALVAYRHLEECRTARVRAAVEAETLMTLRERALHAHRKEAARRSQHEMDDVQMRRWPRAEADAASEGIRNVDFSGTLGQLRG